MLSDPLSNISGPLCIVGFVVLVTVLYIWAVRKRYSFKVRPRRDILPGTDHKIVQVESPITRAIWRKQNDVDSRASLIEMMKQVEESQSENQIIELEKKQNKAEIAPSKPKRKSKRGRRGK